MPDPDLQQRLLADLQQFAVPRHARWDPLGPLEEHRFGSGSEGGTNLILRLPGRESHRRPLLVGAHYDGPLQSPGADDNASGLVALLELARHWAADPPRRPVWLVAFDQEEWGMVGSRALAQELRAIDQPIKLMVSLEMRAVYGDRGDFIALVANTGAAWLLPVPFGGRLIPDVRLSDHSPFWDAGYDALMVTDTSFMRNPHYHRMSDTVDTLDLPFFCGVVEGLAAAFGSL